MTLSLDDHVGKNLYSQENNNNEILAISIQKQ